jgi:UDP-glucose 4-epimerase
LLSILPREASRHGARTAPLDVVLDLTTPEALDPFVDENTTIFHLAGSASVRASIENPTRTFNDTVAATVAVLESARKARGRILLASSAAVCDPAGPLPFTEAAALRPPSPYAAAKLAAEAYGLAYHRTYGLDVRIARMFSVYGPGMQQFAIHDFCRRLVNNPDRLVIGGDGGQTRDYLHVDDVVRALFMVAQDGETGEIYNVATGQPRTIREVGSAVARAMGLDNAIIECDGRNAPTEPYRMEADISRLRTLGFRPAITFERGLADTVKWLMTQTPKSHC